MKKRLGLVLLWLVVALFWMGMEVKATEKYATVVNPVRSRELWKDKSLEPLLDQYKAVEGRGLKATWLLQNDVLSDKEVMAEIKKFNNNQELGVFLEISRNLALRSRLYFEENRPWHDPGVIFLSAYNRKERKKLIDVMMKDFKAEFGYWPKSVGAWWIDSYSLSYLEKEYKIKSALIVTDQKTTDHYGVWGQWWGYPYFPDKNNILIPGDSSVLVIQWALRDPVKAYFGEGPKVSNYSLQANDYISQGLDINYFNKLANIYFDERNKLGQITVGLETGIESVAFLQEFERQMAWIKKNGIKDVTMSRFSDIYKKSYGKNPPEIYIENWKLTPEYRENKSIDERTDYKKGWVFGDFYQADKSDFLNRIYKENNLKAKKIIDEEVLIRMVAITIGLGVGIKFLKKRWWIALGVWGIWWLGEHFRYSVVEGEKVVGWLVDNLRFVGIGTKGPINRDFSILIAQSMLKLKIPESVYGGYFLVGVLIVQLYYEIFAGRKNKKSN